MARAAVFALCRSTCRLFTGLSPKLLSACSGFSRTLVSSREQTPRIRDLADEKGADVDRFTPRWGQPAPLGHRLFRSHSRTGNPGSDCACCLATAWDRGVSVSRRADDDQ